jgi:hypothetical protein
VARCRWIIVIALGVLAAYETGDAQAIAANAPASRFVLTGDVQEMPILLVKGYAIKEGTLRLESDGRSYLLNNIRIDGVLVKSVPHVEIHHEPFAAAKPIGITEQNIVTFGFGLLNQYTTVWDYQAKRIYLLER